MDKERISGVHRYEKYKIILLGDQGCGKSSVMKRFTRNTFSFSTESTLGFEYDSRFIIINKEKIQLQIWDTMGQEQYMSLTTSYFQNCLGVVLIYDIGRQSSIDSLQLWLEQIKENCDPNVVVFIVGNKNDLQHLRVLSLEEMQDQLNHFFHLEVSALNGYNIDECFIKLSQAIQLTLLKPKDIYDTPRVSYRLSHQSNYSDQQQSDLTCRC